MTALEELIALCQRLELPLTLAWHPDAEAPGQPGSGWSVEVGDRSHYGCLDDAVAKHLTRLRGAA
jgi:hypothetical protein